MTYGLLWIETLALCLLYSSVILATGLRRQERRRKVIVTLTALFFPLYPLGMVTGHAFVLRRAVGAQAGGLKWSLILVGCHLVGALLLLLLARRRDASGAHRGASWSTKWLSAATVLVVVMIVLTIWNMLQQARQEMELRTLEAKLIAARITPGPISDTFNAWRLYQQADAQLRSIPGHEQDDYQMLGNDVDADPPQAALYLQRRTAILALARRAAEMPHCRPDVDFIDPQSNSQPNNLAAFHNLSRLLALAAQSEAARGDVAAALADGMRVYAIGQHAATATPTILGLLMDLSAEHVANKALIAALPHVTDPAQLAAITLPDNDAWHRATARAFLGEEAWGMARICQTPAEFAVLSPKDPNPMGLSALWMVWFRYDLATYRDYLHQVQSLAVQSYFEVSVKIRQLGHRYIEGPDGGLMTKAFAGMMPVSVSALARGDARRAVIHVALAATKYRLDHGNQYPATGQELVPQYIDAWPVDPFDGKPLRYLRHEDGTLTIYSVGDDLQDDGGKIDRPDAQHRVPDEGYRLPLPPAR